MRSRTLLSAVVLSLVLGAHGVEARPGAAKAIAPARGAAIEADDQAGFGVAFAQVQALSSWLPHSARWLAAALPAVDGMFDADGWSTRWLVTMRDLSADALAVTAERSRSLFALLPASPIPDLSTLTASPVPGVESSGFGWRRDPIHKRDKFHKGTDFRADRGTPVYAAGAGIVAFTGRQTGYGNVIYVDHGGGVVTRYAHLSRIEVKAGAAVPAAQRIGRVGSTGRATGPHLHFEIRLEGRAVDPELAMHVAALQRTSPLAAQLAAWSLSPAAQETRVDRHDPPRRGRASAKPGSRPERRNAPQRDRHRS